MNKLWQMDTHMPPLSHPVCANIILTVVLFSQVLLAVILLEVTTVSVEYVEWKFVLESYGRGKIDYLLKKLTH